MNINEICVGDWVQDRKGNTAQIIGIELWSGAYEVNVRINGGDVGLTPASSCDPIPLTPEILEKNGFEIADEFADCQMYGSPECSIVHTKGTMRYRLEAPQASVVCWNVHQLQHALRLAGIEKEIEV